MSDTDQATWCARIVTLEVKHEQCAEDRVAAKEALSDLSKAMMQLQGAAKMLVVLWAIATAGIGALAASGKVFGSSGGQNVASVR